MFGQHRQGMVFIKSGLSTSFALSTSTSFPHQVKPKSGTAVPTWTKGSTSSLMYLEAQAVTMSAEESKRFASFSLIPVR